MQADDQLIPDLMMFLRKYVRLSGDDEYFVIAVWIVHCHAWLAWTRTPYLNVDSPLPECGKTVLLELIVLVTPNAQLLMGCSSEVRPRVIDELHPPLLIDEIDQLAKGDKELWAALLQTINSGYKKSGNRLVLEPSKGGWRTRSLSTFCPKALSGITAGLIPPATLSRCIPIHMQRMMRNDRVAEIDEYITEPEAEALFKRCQAWTKAHLKQLRDARPDAPSTLGHRQREVSRPLLAIADAMGEEWGKRLRIALVRLFAVGTDEPNDDIQAELLHDMVEVFGNRQKISSKDAVTKLMADPDAPWVSYGKSEKPITQTKLAELLWKFKIVPKMQRNDDGSNLRGYDRAKFEDLWKRYLNPETEPPIDPLTPHFVRNSATTPVNIEENEIPDRNNEPDVAPLKSSSDPMNSGLLRVLRVGMGGTRERAPKRLLKQEKGGDHTVSPTELISVIEALGGEFTLDGEKIQCDLPIEAEELVPALQENRAGVYAALLERERKSAASVEVEVACRCSKWPFPHIHRQEDRRRAIEKWNRISPHKLEVKWIQ